MTRYLCSGFRPLTNPDIYTVDDVARIFGERLAQRTFGKRGYCHHVRLDSWRQDQTQYDFEVFIGVPADGGGTSGRNEWLSITVSA